MQILVSTDNKKIANIAKNLKVGFHLLDQKAFYLAELDV